MKEENIERGRLSRQRGEIFERKVINSLRVEGYIVTRFNGDIDLEAKSVISAKFNPFRRNTTGFPDLLITKPTEAFFVECKVNNQLRREERLKLEFLEEKGFRCYVASNNNGTINFRRLAETSPGTSR